MMKQSNHLKVCLMVMVVTGLVFFSVSAWAAQSLGEGANLMVQGADQMLKGEKMLVEPLNFQGLNKDAGIKQGLDKIAKGESMIMEGKNLFMQPDTRIKGKEMMMSGSTMMMQGKDEVIERFQKDEAFKTGKLMAAWKNVVNGEYEMMEGKNLMMKGLRLYE